MVLTDAGLECLTPATLPAWVWSLSGRGSLKDKTFGYQPTCVGAFYPYSQANITVLALMLVYPPPLAPQLTATASD